MVGKSTNLKSKSIKRLGAKLLLGLLWSSRPCGGHLSRNVIEGFKNVRNQILELGERVYSFKLLQQSGGTKTPFIPSPQDSNAIFFDIPARLHKEFSQRRLKKDLLNPIKKEMQELRAKKTDAAKVFIVFCQNTDLLGYLAGEAKRVFLY